MDRRPPIAEAIKDLIRQEFALVPEGRTGALLVIADDFGPRLHLAHKFNDRWKVGAAVGTPWGWKPTGRVSIEASW